MTEVNEIYYRSPPIFILHQKVWLCLSWPSALRDWFLALLATNRHIHLIPLFAERITQNPHLETVPDHAGPHYDPIHALLVTMGITNKQAVQMLNTSWTCSHEEQIQAWDQQVIDDVAAQEEEWCLCSRTGGSAVHSKRAGAGEWTVRGWKEEA